MLDEEAALRQRLETHPAVMAARRLGQADFPWPRIENIRTLEVSPATVPDLAALGLRVEGPLGTGNRVTFDKSIKEADLSLHFYDNASDNELVIERSQTLRGHVHFRGPSHIAVLCRGWHNITVDFIHERGCLYIGPQASIGDAYFRIEGDARSVILGTDCLLAWSVGLRTGDSHGLIDIASRTVTNPPRDIVLESRVWLGQEVLVSKGVTIGKSSSVGARSVVTRNLPEACVAVGMPAKSIRQGVTWCYANRPSQAQIDQAVACLQDNTPS